jgi:hypothetical protein
MVTRPVPGDTAATLDSIRALCDAADAFEGRIADQETRLATAQAAFAAEAQARRQAVTGEAQARAAADTEEAQARDAAIRRERQDRAAAIAVATDGFAGRLGALGEALRDAVRAEARARAGADDEERAARAAAVAVVTTELDAQTARIRVLAAQESALTEAVAALRAQADALAATVAAQRLDFVAPPGRPGDAPARYAIVSSAAALGGPRPALPLVPAAMLASGDSGAVVRIDGAAILAGRAACPLEPGRLYRIRTVVQRRADPADPSGDAVVCGAVFLDQALRVLGDVAPLRIFPALTAAFGRQEAAVLIARGGGLGEAVTAPPRARFLVPVVAAYGPDAVTDVEVLQVEDVTGAFVLAPPPDGLEAQIALRLADLTARLQGLERVAGTPGTLTFGSRGEAAAATIPESVQAVALLGRRYPGDGGAGLFVRASGDAPPAGAETFVSHGALFRRVPPLPDLAAGVLAAGFATFMAELPTRPPPAPGTAWNDAGIPTLTPREPGA